MEGDKRISRITVLSFDVFGTLLDLEEDKSRPDAYRQLARWLGYHGILVDGDELRCRLEASIAQELQRSTEEHPDVEISSLLGGVLIALAPGSCSDIHALLAETALLLRTLTTQSLSVVPGAKEALEELGKHYRLGICSNTQRAYTIGELRMFGLLDFFEHIVFSSDVKVTKPNPKIFRVLLERFGVSADSVCHIGDNMGDDVEGASVAGMATILFERTPTAHPMTFGGAHSPTAIVTALEQLRVVLPRGE